MTHYMIFFLSHWAFLFAQFSVFVILLSWPFYRWLYIWNLIDLTLEQTTSCAILIQKKINCFGLKLIFKSINKLPNLLANQFLIQFKLLFDRLSIWLNYLAEFFKCCSNLGHSNPRLTQTEYLSILNLLGKQTLILI